MQWNLYDCVTGLDHSPHLPHRVLQHQGQPRTNQTSPPWWPKGKSLSLSNSIYHVHASTVASPIVLCFMRSFQQCNPEFNITATFSLLSWLLTVVLHHDFLIVWNTHHKFKVSCVHRLAVTVSTLKNKMTLSPLKHAAEAGCHAPPSQGEAPHEESS